MSKRTNRTSPASNPPPAASTASRAVLLAALGCLVVGFFIGRALPGQPASAASANATKAASTEELTSSQRASLGEFVTRYFSSWSNKDIDSYGRCFHPNAAIWFGTGSPMGLPGFLDSQRQAHASSPVPLTEQPLSWNGNIANGLAHVRVHWELHRGNELVRGYDFFTLALADGQWRIIALVFNEE